ncbi:hypothetical protein HA402_007821 [Bradysia odoriphaga]|nr:hypothetical protein HA402_007821 [Bradysia odoriphaga]
MSSSPSDATVCTSCRKTEGQLPNRLKRCAKCKGQWYCSRECQKSDWKVHKKVCSNNRPESEPTSKSNGNAPTPNAVCYKPKPFTALSNGTWLHDRPKKDVFKLLIDTYRMRIEDEYVFQGEVDEDSLYGGGGAANALRHFRRFMNKAFKTDAKRCRKRLLPEWFSKESLQECVDFARTDKFSNVGFAVEKHDIQEHYAQLDMPMQLRMFSEKLDGYLATGMSCESMLQLQVAAERDDIHATHLSF